MYNLPPSRRATNSVLPTTISGSRASRADDVEANVAAAREWFGKTMCSLQRPPPVPGSVDDLELPKAQDPEGAFSGPMLALREGRYQPPLVRWP